MQISHNNFWRFFRAKISDFNNDSNSTNRLLKKVNICLFITPSIIFLNFFRHILISTKIPLSKKSIFIQLNIPIQHL